MFLSAVWPLNLTAPIHGRGPIAEQVQICSDEETLIYIMEWSEGDQI